MLRGFHGAGGAGGDGSMKSTSEAVGHQGRLGIMGGGQLGMFLCQSARALGVRTTVLETNPDGSALPYANDTIVAALDDAEAVERLIEASDVVTFELEAIPDESLEQLRVAERAGRLRVHPSCDTLALFKDKGVQKRWLRDQGLPTLPFLDVVDGHVPDALSGGAWSLPVVQKAHRGGYDGKGVQLLRTAEDLERLWDVPSYLEPALDPCLELSVVVARDGDGGLRAFPPVSMTFDARYNAVHSVTSPAEVAPSLAGRARRIAQDAVGRLSTPGVFAVELFVDHQDHVTINEISPRVHNSGHLTIEGFRHDQFEQHVRAVMGRPLAPVTPVAPVAVMLNILYDDALEAACPSAPGVLERGEDIPVRVHWYGKSTGQAGRKMGHLTAWGEGATAVREAAEAALRDLECAPDLLETETP